MDPETAPRTEDGKLDYEIVLVNDSSPDDTFKVIKALCEKNPKIIGIDFAQNFGQPDIGGNAVIPALSNFDHDFSPVLLSGDSSI